jgi:hypothetical protein
LKIYFWIWIWVFYLTKQDSNQFSLKTLVVFILKKWKEIFRTTKKPKKSRFLRLYLFYSSPNGTILEPFS